MATTRRSKRGASTRGSRGSSRNSPPAKESGDSRASSRRSARVAEAEPAAKPSSRASAKSSSKASSTRRSAAAPAAGDEGGDNSTRASRRGSTRKESQREPKSWKDNLKLYVIVVFIVIGVTLALSWPSIQRNMKLGQLDETTDLAEAKTLADEYLTITEANPRYVEIAITGDHGPVETQLYLAEQIKSVPSYAVVLRRDSLTDEQRMTALNLFAEQYSRDDSNHTNTQLDPKQLMAWAAQDEREPDDRHIGLAQAAVRVIARRGKDLTGTDPAQVLCGMVGNAGQNPLLIETIVEELPQVLNADNVGYIMDEMVGANADTLLASQALMSKVGAVVRPAHIGEIFEMLDHERTAIKAAGIQFLQGNGMSAVPPSQAEDIGRRISAYLGDDTRTESPAVFSEALKAVGKLNLTGARKKMFEMLPKLDPESPEAESMADTLGRLFVVDDKDPVRQRVAEDVLEGLTRAVDNPDSRITAAKALLKVKATDLPGLRDALEACIRHGTEPLCFEAAKHICRDLFARNDVVQKLGDDVAAWSEFLAGDRGRFEEFMSIADWHAENAEVRATDDIELIMANKARCEREMARLEQWLGDTGQPMPLGLTKSQVERQLKGLSTFKYSLLKAMPGL